MKYALGLALKNNPVSMLCITNNLQTKFNLNSKSETFAGIQLVCLKN